MKDRSYEPLEKVGTITKHHFQCQKNNTMTLNDNYQPLHKSEGLNVSRRISLQSTMPVNKHPKEVS